MNRKMITKTGLIIGLTFLFSARVFAEEVKVSTYYPSPYGSYKNLDSSSDTHLATTSGNVGIGTATPRVALDVNGWISLGGGYNGTSYTPASGALSGRGIYFPSTTNDGTKIFGEHDGGDTSNLVIQNDDNINDGVLFRENDCCGGGSGDYMKISREKMFYMGGAVVIGSTSPTTGSKLDVNGTVTIRGGTPGPGKVLTSDADGNATWQVPTWG